MKYKIQVDFADNQWGESGYKSLNREFESVDSAIESLLAEHSQGSFYRIVEIPLEPRVCIVVRFP